MNRSIYNIHEEISCFHLNFFYLPGVNVCFKSIYSTVYFPCVNYVTKEQVYVLHFPHFTGLLFKCPLLNETTCKLFNNCSRSPFNTSPLPRLKQVLNALMSPYNANECEVTISQWLLDRNKQYNNFPEIIGNHLSTPDQ